MTDPTLNTHHTIFGAGVQYPAYKPGRDVWARVVGAGYRKGVQSRQIAPVVSEITATSSRAQRVICASSLCNFSGWLEAGRGFFQRASA